MAEIKNNDVNAALIHELLREKRADRRWKNVRFIAWFALFIFLIAVI